ncbi:glucoside xylosyltransferase 1 [Cydia amplana]|uniref:glucoside xylosyltransferase 1 n=1 Tax=Cydia amplana TaxID=1869771 RepID=UPI002FE549AD
MDVQLEINSLKYIMRRLPLWKIVVLLGFSFMIIYLYSWISNDDVSFVNRPRGTASTQLLTLRPQSTIPQRTTINRIVLSFVVCDSRFNESLNVVKSVLLFTKTPVHFVIFTDDNLKLKFNDTLSNWRVLTDYQLDFELHSINFPEEHVDDWMNLFSKCAAQRLFIPKLITHIDAMIYVDTDTLFLGPADELWLKFSLFNISQISAMALENDNPNVSWYPRFAKHPFYGKYGLNSGVMLMNLTRMRDFGWVDYVTPIMLKWKLYIPWGDQDIINVIFHYHPRAVLELSCRYNYRTDQCMYGDACPDATAAGVFLLHGSRKAFHAHKQPAFEAVYRAVEEWSVGLDPSDMPAVLERYYTEAPPSLCGNLKDAFLKVPTATIAELHRKPDRDPINRVATSSYEVEERRDQE